MLSDGGVFINVQKINLRKYASRPALAKVMANDHTRSQVNETERGVVMSVQVLFCLRVRAH